MVSTDSTVQSRKQHANPTCPLMYKLPHQIRNVAQYCILDWRARRRVVRGIPMTPALPKGNSQHSRGCCDCNQQNPDLLRLIVQNPRHVRWRHPLLLGSLACLVTAHNGATREVASLHVGWRVLLFKFRSINCSPMNSLMPFIMTEPSIWWIVQRAS